MAPETDVEHVGDVRTEPDIRGVVIYGRCLCGWRGPTHPAAAGKIGEAKVKALADLTAHLERSSIG